MWTWTVLSQINSCSSKVLVPFSVRTVLLPLMWTGYNYLTKLYRPFNFCWAVSRTWGGNFWRLMVPILITKNLICNSNYSIFVFISYSSWKISVENQVWKIKPLKTYYGLHKTETSTYHNLFPQKMESRQSRSRPFDQAEIVQLSSLMFYKEKKVLFNWCLICSQGNGRSA